MTKQQTYITFITDLLKNGVVEWNKVFALFSRKFPLSRKTFDKYWKIANEAHNKAQQAINEQKAKDYEQSQLNANKGLILSREELLRMTANVVKLTYKHVEVSKGKDPKAVMAFNAAAENFKRLEGYDKPSKLETTVENIKYTLKNRNAAIN